MPSESIVPRVLLIGCGPTALTALESLAERMTVLGLVRDHDPLDPGADPVCRRAVEHGVPLAGDISVWGIEQLVDRLRPDCVVVSSYNRVLPACVVAKTRFVNVHYALLPRYRGRANVNWAIINGEVTTGISIHVLSPDLDGGNILFQEPVAIESADTVSSLYEKLNALQREHLGATVVRHLHGDDGCPQAAEEATYGCTRLPLDGEIDWAQPGRRVYDLIRALTPPYPGAFTYFEGIPVTIWRAELVCDPPRYDGRIPGRVVRVSKTRGWVEVLTGDGVLRVHEVQRADGHRCPAAKVLNSVKHTLGLHWIDLLNRLRALESAIAELLRQDGQLLPSSGEE
jgi:methionyl-tRNA formyltransferase